MVGTKNKSKPAPLNPKGAAPVWKVNLRASISEGRRWFLLSVSEIEWFRRGRRPKSCNGQKFSRRDCKQVIWFALSEDSIGLAPNRWLLRSGDRNLFRRLGDTLE